MHSGNSNSLSPLDKLRIEKGTKKLKDHFCELAESNSERAAGLLNEKNLLFPSLFLLRQEIERFKLNSSLNPLLQKALEVTDSILDRSIYERELLSETLNKNIHHVFKWIIETGYHDDGLNNEFDELLDLVCSLTVKTFKDKSVLPIVIRIISDRYSKNKFYYDLAWVFFEACERESLLLIASLLLSADRKDVELACRLLSFVPGINKGNNTNYQCFINWFYDNYYFMYYTGESFHQTFNPKPYAVNLEAKYMCKAVLADNGRIPAALTKTEQKLITRYKKLGDNDKILLSRYSYFLHRKNLQLWRVWLHQPLDEQLRIARAMSGGVL
jgi:hypothetical protein